MINMRNKAGIKIYDFNENKTDYFFKIQRQENYNMIYLNYWSNYGMDNLTVNLRLINSLNYGFLIYKKFTHNVHYEI
jgi:hypothetical protein